MSCWVVTSAKERHHAIGCRGGLVGEAGESPTPVVVKLLKNRHETQARDANRLGLLIQDNTTIKSRADKSISRKYSI